MNTTETKIEKTIGWQTVDSAPKDGAPFLSLNVNCMNLYAVTWWCPVRGYFKSTGGQELYHFTHWLPLPLPPEHPKTLQFVQNVRNLIGEQTGLKNDL